MKSILQDRKECLICRTTANLEEHHCFSGVRRQAAEKHGLKVWLCRAHHTGPDGVHNDQSLKIKLMQMAQTEFEKKYGRRAFLEAFGKNYTGEERE